MRLLLAPFALPLIALAAVGASLMFVGDKILDGINALLDWAGVE